MNFRDKTIFWKQGPFLFDLAQSMLPRFLSYEENLPGNRPSTTGFATNKNAQPSAQGEDSR